MVKRRPSAKELKAMAQAFVPRRSWISEAPSSRVKEIARDHPRSFVPKQKRKR
jgi:hypothetical protein